MKKHGEKELRKLPADGKIAYLIKPILKVLQDAGGQLERSEIKERIADIDDQIAEYAEEVKQSKRTGNTYKEFNFKFHGADSYSECAIYVGYYKRHTDTDVTQLGNYVHFTTCIYKP